MTWLSETLGTGPDFIEHRNETDKNKALCGVKEDHRVRMVAFIGNKKGKTS
jgi:hypothetical protein